MGKESLFVVRERLEVFLDHLADRTQNDAKEGLTDISKLSEAVVRNLMNALYDYELASEEKPNAAGFDLCDSKSCILVQVTRECTNKKIKECLRTTANRIAKEPELTDAELYIVFLTMKKDKIDKLSAKTANKLLSKELKAKGFRFEAENLLCLRTFVNFLIKDERPDKKPLKSEQVEDIQELLDNYDPGSKDIAVINLPPISKLNASDFVGRDNELQEIERRIRDEDKPIVLSGEGGIGKTELAVRFGVDYYRNGKGNVYFARFNMSFTRTLSDMATGIQPELAKEKLASSQEERCGVVLKLLLKCSSKSDILIIDNVDSSTKTLNELMDDDAYQYLLKLKLQLLLTSRQEYDRGNMGVSSMPNNMLFEIFNQRGLSLEESQMTALIDAVEGNTLVIDLIARTLAAKSLRRVTPEYMLSALENRTLPNENFRKVPTDYNQSNQKEPIYMHLKRVYKVADMSPEKKAILRCATLLPGRGMDSELFASCFSEDEEENIYSLVEHGWIGLNHEVVTIHPIIRLVCREELEPMVESCVTFLRALWEQYENKKLDINQCFQVAGCIQEGYGFLVQVKIKSSLPSETSDWIDQLLQNWLKPILEDIIKKSRKRNDSSDQAGMPKDAPCPDKGLPQTYQNISISDNSKDEVESQYLGESDICNLDSTSRSLVEWIGKINRLLMQFPPDSPEAKLLCEQRSLLERRLGQ